MRRSSIAVSVIFLVCFLLPAAFAQDGGTYQRVQHLMDSVQVMEGHIFAPKTYGKAAAKFAEAGKAIDRGKKGSKIERLLSEAAEYAENALKAAEVAKLTLAEYLEPRELAKAAKAPSLVPELYEKAGLQFLKATSKVESGNVKNGLKEADKAMPLFIEAELQAIRTDIMGPADKLIARAVADDAEKYALSTLDKARTARAKCDAILMHDRYERNESLAEIKRARYEARHASNIAQSVRSLNRNDQAWEKLILVYEIQMNRVGEAIGAMHLPFDEGAIAAADSLIQYIKDMQSTQSASATQTDELTRSLRTTLGRFGVGDMSTNPVSLAEQIDRKVVEAQSEQKNMLAEIASVQGELGDLQTSHQQVAAELEERTAREEKFKKAKTIINPSEGQVLFNASNDIVLRLQGMSFGINKSEITDEHVPLLKKVQTIIELFPDAKLVIEGHTDASGDAATNRQLSEKRAYSVMQYLRQSMLISADRITAIGYGAEKPVASNQTADSRAKNRRIDILIMH